MLWSHLTHYRKQGQYSPKKPAELRKSCWIGRKYGITRPLRGCREGTDRWHFWPLRCRGRFELGKAPLRLAVSVSFSKNSSSSGFCTEGWVWAETRALSLRGEGFLGLKSKAGGSGGSSGYCSWRIESGLPPMDENWMQKAVAENLDWEHSLPAPDVSFQEGGHQSTWRSWSLSGPASSPWEVKFLAVSGEGIWTKRRGLFLPISLEPGWEYRGGF